MPATNPILKIEVLPVNDLFRLVATYADGHTSVWGDCRIERGAQAKLTQHAKRFGLTKINKNLAVA